MDLVAHEDLLATLKARSADVSMDGPVVASRYEQSRVRMMWVLREGHGSKGWDYREFVDKNLFAYRQWRRTLGPVARVSDGIIGGCLPYADLTNDKVKLNDRLREVAIVNVNKEGGDKRVNWERFCRVAICYGPEIMRQIEYLDPHVVVFAGTFGVLNTSIRQAFVGFPETAASGVFFNGRVYISAYHPNQRGIPHSKYYENIRVDVQRLLPRRITEIQVDSA